MYTNVNQIIYAAAGVFFVYTKTLHSLFFEFLHQQQSSILFNNFAKFQDKSFHIHQGLQMNLYYRFIL